MQEDSRSKPPDVRHYDSAHMKKQAAAEAAACFGLLMDADDAVVLTQTRVAVGNEGFAVPLDENDDHIRQADVRNRCRAIL